MAASIAFTPPARIIRALTLADLLDAAGIAASDAATMHPAEWRMLAQAGRTPIPSQTTREMVVTLLSRRESVRIQFKSQGR